MPHHLSRGGGIAQQTDKQTDRLREAEKLTSRETDKHIDRQTNRHTVIK